MEQGEEYVNGVTDVLNSRSFYYPLLFLRPEFDGPALTQYPFRIAKRKWETSTFDLATLATNHKLNLSYQAMDIFLSRCNMELCIEGKPSVEEANHTFQLLRVCLYSSGVSPFLCPFVTTHSINEYSGINSRDSKSLREQMHPGMEVGLTSDAGILEAWPLELSFQCIVVPEALGLSEQSFLAGSAKAVVWEKMLNRFPQLHAVVDAATAAPTLGNRGQSLLHIWSGLEALFPSVNSEVSFRLALYISQLAATAADRLTLYQSVRSAYGIRSKVAHGANSRVSKEEWDKTWSILKDCLNALARREGLPSEQELLFELLG